VPADYPFKPPLLKFTTRVYHPNVDRQGGICLDLLKENWSSAFTIQRVLLALSALLDKPNPEDPLMPDIATEYKTNPALFAAKARECTLKYAAPAGGAAAAAASSSSSAAAGKGGR
jgi:ubiquitin-conjugating enzyme E2 D/E